MQAFHKMMMDKTYMLVVCVVTAGLVAALPACDSEIWCHGDLLSAVQDERLFNDSKTFVDMNLKADPAAVLTAFKALSGNSSSSPRKEQLKNFLNTYFEGPNTEFEHWVPADYKENPRFLTNVKDEELRRFGKALCKKWSVLGRKIKQAVKNQQDRYSLIYLEQPFIVPGGRFRETYYWDSYWVVKGLLACEMTTTVKGMLENFISLVKRFGMVPNGNRVYYTRRSQPPFLIPMVDLYIKATNDTAFLAENIAHLAAEYQFWSTNRTVECCNGTTVNRYAAPITEPRPESFTEDETTQRKSQDNSSKMFENLASAAESGWDFSSRWFSDDFQKVTSDEKQWLRFTNTIDIIPVDLNSILCWNERMLSTFYNLIGNHNDSTQYLTLHEQRKKIMQQLFWDEEKGAWFDISLSQNKKRTQFFPSNVFPLYTECYQTQNSSVEDKVLQYLKTVNVLGYDSGVPTSRVETGQQWDYPNAWPPLQDVIVSALAKSQNPESRELAIKLANRWITSNYIGWMKTGGNMFEKYIVTAKGSRGSGGEYDVQEGFGWTNGVVLDFLARFGPDLSLDLTSATNAAFQTCCSVNVMHVTVFLLTGIMINTRL